MVKIADTHVLKNVDYYSVKLDKYLYKDLETIIRRCNKAKTIIAHRYSSIKNITTINNSRKYIRDIWTANGIIDKFNIPKRYVRNAIEDVASDIKKSWTNVSKDINKHINADKTLLDAEKHYIRYVLKCNDILQNILNYKTYSIPTKFDNINNTQRKKLNTLIRRLVRKYLPNKSRYNHTGSILIDSEMYDCKNGIFYLTGLNKGKRYEIKLKTHACLKGSLRLKLVNGHLRIINCISVKTKENNNTNVIGVDKNYINALDTSNYTSYGTELNALLDNYTDVLNAKNKKRQVYHELIKKSKSKNKIYNIKKFNLGTKKYNRNKNRLKEEIRKKINVGIKQLIAVEKPKEIAIEKLNFTTKNKRTTNKKTKNKLSSWMKGLINDRVIYNASVHGIKIFEVNAAFTSQTCDECGHFGDRIGDMFHCQNCGRVEKSGFVAANNVVHRRYDPDITVGMSPYIVRKVIKKRLLDKNYNHKMIITSNRTNQDQSFTE